MNQTGILKVKINETSILQTGISSTQETKFIYSVLTSMKLRAIKRTNEKSSNKIKLENQDIHLQQQDCLDKIKLNKLSTKEK